MSSGLHSLVEQTLRTMPARSLHVGFSGGLDSTVLLHLLSALPAAREIGLRAIHIHHGLSPQADDWATHCQRLCDAWSVPLTVLEVDVARNAGDGPEAAARKARHAAFEHRLGVDEVLVSAHHRDDQAETFLLRALRASGPDGLAAMRPLRQFGHGWLWRPLLGVSREQLLAHAQGHGLDWIEDASNQDTSFDRNFLRHRVLPLLRERWPQVDAAFARSASLCADASVLLADEDAHALAGVRGTDPDALIVERLQTLSEARRARVLRRWIAELALPPLPAQGIAHIEQDLLAATPDTNASFVWAGAVVQRWRGLLHAQWQRESLPQDWSCDWDGRTPLALPGGGQLRLEGAQMFDASLRVHARRGGERITLPGREHSHALKHVLQDLGVPPWQRAHLPLLSSGTTLLAAGDLLYSATFDAWLRERNAHLAWTP